MAAVQLSFDGFRGFGVLGFESHAGLGVSKQETDGRLLQPCAAQFDWLYAAAVLKVPEQGCFLKLSYLCFLYRRIVEKPYPSTPSTATAKPSGYIASSSSVSQVLSLIFKSWNTPKPLLFL